MEILGIIALFIPIIFLIGLFSCIGLNIYYKYKTNTVMSERVPLETLGEWYKMKSIAKTLRSRGLALHLGCFLGGAGLGVAIGCIVRTITIHRQAISNLNYESEGYYVFMIIALGIFCGGLGMIGAYFLERRLNKDTKCE